MILVTVTVAAAEREQNEFVKFMNVRQRQKPSCSWCGKKQLQKISSTFCCCCCCREMYKKTNSSKMTPWDGRENRKPEQDLLGAKTKRRNLFI